MSLIQGIQLKKSYDQGLTNLFTDVNFSIDEGKHIALVGANGTGKSTLDTEQAVIAECVEVR